MLWKLPAISVKPDVLIEGGPDFLTNSFLLTVISALIIIGIFALATRRPNMVPGFLQNFVEWVFQSLLNLCEQVAGRDRGRRFFPWVASIFLLVLISNWWEVIPFIETIGTKDAALPGCANHVSGFFLTGSSSNCIRPFFRPPATDLNFTIALALITVVLTQVYGFKLLGVGKQLGRYFTLRNGVIGLVVGILEFLLEFLRVLSLSFRLFGNLFAGDVLLLVLSYISVGVAAIPFYFLEVFVGFIQAFVFAFLTLLFLTLGTTVHGHDETTEHAVETAREEHVEQRREALAAERAESVAAR